MNKTELLLELKNLKENGAELPNGYHLMGEEKLEALYKELTGNEIKLTSEGPAVAEPVVTPNFKSETNPFGEDIIDTFVHEDPLNKTVKVKWVSVNGESLWFPVGKIAKMPKSFHEVYVRSVQGAAAANSLLAENSMKEV